MTTKKNIIAGTIITGALTLQSTLSDAQGGSSANKIGEQILPYKVHFSDADLADLKRRILATKWPDREIVKDASQGVQLTTMQKLAKYWATEYDWRKVEARLNALPPVHYQD
jgi:hypothetical protein